jgi:hypothetical protein
MAEQRDLVHTVDFYGFGLEAGKAWRQQYYMSDANTYLSHVASEMQSRTYHLRRCHFPSALIAAWEQGFRNGAMQP